MRGYIEYTLPATTENTATRMHGFCPGKPIRGSTTNVFSGVPGYVGYSPPSTYQNFRLLEVKQDFLMRHVVHTVQAE